MGKKEEAGSHLDGAEELSWYHSRIKRMLHLWLQLAGCVEDGGEVARWILVTGGGKSRVEAKLKECGLCRSREQIIP